MNTTIDINFFVFSEYDPKVLLVGDNSEWLHIEDKPSNIEITMPGSKVPKIYSFKKGSVNAFNSHNLGISCLKGDCTDEVYVDIPDGIYTITVKGSPSTNFKTKYHLKTDKLSIRIDKLLIDLGFEFEDTKVKERDDILDIKFNIMIAEAYIKREDLNKSKMFFDRAVSLTDKLERCK